MSLAYYMPAELCSKMITCGHVEAQQVHHPPHAPLPRLNDQPMAAERHAQFCCSINMSQLPCCDNNYGSPSAPHPHIAVQISKYHHSLRLVMMVMGGRGGGCSPMSDTASRVKVCRFWRAACSSCMAALMAPASAATCCSALLCTACRAPSKDEPWAA